MRRSGSLRSAGKADHGLLKERSAALVCALIRVTKLPLVAACLEKIARLAGQ